MQLLFPHPTLNFVNEPPIQSPRYPKSDWETIVCPVCGLSDFEPLFELRTEPFVRCRSCTLTLINPRPRRHVLYKQYDVAYTETYTAKAEKKLKRSRRRVRRLKREYHLTGRWLDVGCSAGFTVKAAEEEGFEAHGLDISSGAIEYGEKNLGLEHLVHGDLADQSYPDGHFSAVSVYDVIEHVTDLQHFVRELKRVLAPDGVIDIGTPDIGHWRVPRELKKWNEFKPSEHLYYFNRSTLERVLNDNDLRIDRIRFAFKPGLKICVRRA